MTTSIFHEGDLQSGIARAIAESKLVICFIRDDDHDECRVWESDWLGDKDGDGSIGAKLAPKAVLLRIDSPSQEASFLSAFCTVDETPMLVVIHNGQVLEKLQAGISKDEFRERLFRACGMDDTESTIITPESEDGRMFNGDAIISTATTEAPRPDATQPELSNNARALLIERARRLDAERLKREAAEKAERLARANARRAEAENAASAEQSSSTSRSSEKQKARDAWIHEQKKRKDEAKKERERILKQIESDKQNRRAQKERELEARQAGGTGGSSKMETKTSRSIPSPNAKCALQVRLFDGSSIRGTFSSDTTLAEAVRAWIKQASPDGGADVPYTFRQILAPQPSRSIEVSEEHRSLYDLDLFPNATLVLVPVAGYTSAYEGNAGYLGTALNAAYWCAGAATSVIGTALSYVPGANLFASGQNDVSAEQASREGAQGAAADSTIRTDNGKIKTLFDGSRDHDSKSQPATFYNGNSSAFEGNRPDKPEEGGLDR